MMDGPTAKKEMLNGQEVSNNKSVWDRNLVSNLNGHVKITPCLFQKLMESVGYQSKSYLKQINNEWQSKAKKLGPGYPNNHI